MADFQSKLDALPAWPSTDDAPASGGFDFLRKQRDAALARLAVAREWIESQPHGIAPNGQDCATFNDAKARCTCGRDALLKKLEGPK